MKFGMNILCGDDSKGAVRFVGVCAKAGMRAVRLLVDANGSPGSMSPVMEALKKSKMKAVLSLCRITPESSTKDITRFNDEASFVNLNACYERRCAEFDKDVAIGVNLPEGVHLITRLPSARGPSSPGVIRGTMKLRMSQLAHTIHEAGHVVVLPAQVEDIILNSWDGVFHEVLDIEMMMSPQLDFNPDLYRVLTEMKKPFWFGKAGTVGGYVVPAEQGKLLRKLLGMRLPAEYAFLWSEPKVDRWAWSQDGEMVVDILGSTIMAIENSQAVRSGDPELAKHKSRQRAELAK